MSNGHKLFRSFPIVPGAVTDGYIDPNQPTETIRQQKHIDWTIQDGVPQRNNPRASFAKKRTGSEWDN